MVAGVRQTLGSAVYADNVPAIDDHVSAALRARRGGDDRQDGHPGVRPALLHRDRGRAAGPDAWDLSRSAGGSSGGAAAAVAARPGPGRPGQRRRRLDPDPVQRLRPVRAEAVPGPDLRRPAGAGPGRAGHRRPAGPVRCADAALLLDVMTGNQPGDMYTQPPLPAGETFLGCASRPPGRLRIGRTLQHPIEGAAVHPDCVAAYQDASELLASLGHEVEDVAMPFGPDAVPAFETLWYATATLAPVDPAREDRLLPFTAYLRQRGQQTRASELIFAQAYLQLVVRRRAGRAEPLRRGADARRWPRRRCRSATSRRSRRPRTSSGRRPSPRSPRCSTCPGSPAVSVPLHWNAAGLPIGVMLAGRMGEEGTLDLAVCAAGGRPPVAGPSPGPMVRPAGPYCG